MKGSPIFLTAAVYFCICLQQISANNPAPCEDIPSVDFAEIAYSDHTENGSHPTNSTATIECEFRYQIVPTTSATRICSNGSWTGDEPVCRHVQRRCPANAEIAEIYGYECQLPCRNRLNKPCPWRNQKCYCDGVCGWSCIAIEQDFFCPEVAAPDGAMVTRYDHPSGRRRYLDRVFFDCAEGFRYHSGSGWKTCLSSRTWHGDDIVCIPNAVCDELPTVENASPWHSDRLYFVPTESRSYSCNPGYGISGERTITCSDDYTWTEPNFRCTPKSCGYPGDVPNARLGSNQFTFPSQVPYHCVSGYEHVPYTTRFRTCLATQRWSSQIPECRPVQCPAIESIVHGSVRGSRYQFRSSLTFECDEGYRLEGSQRRTCQANATWSVPEALCTEIICGAPTAPVNGLITGMRATYHHNDVIYYGCNQGFTLSGSGSNYCQDTDEWAHPVPICGLPCSYPGKPRNGRLLYQGQQYSGGRVGHGSSVHVTCDRDRGYSVRESTLQCNNGNWSDSDLENMPLCRGRPCWVQNLQTSQALQPLFEPNSARVEQNGVWLSIPDGTKVIYSCERGYRVEGARSFNVTCRNGNGVPRAITPECRPAECPIVSIPIQTGRIRYSRNIQNQRPVHGMWRQLACISGYDSSDSSRHYCDDGQWNVTAQTALRCDPGPCALIDNSSMTSISYNQAFESEREGLKYYPNGTVATVACRREHTLPLGDGTYHCKAREWVPSLPVCLFSPNLAIIAKSEATQSHTNRANRGFPKKALDGRTSGYDRHYSCARTANMTNPWWKTNLRMTYSIVNIKIYNRLEGGSSSNDLAGNNLTGAVVRVGMNSDYRQNEVCGQPISQNAFESSNSGNHGILIRCGEREILGQYVSVNIPTRRGATRQLILCEVEVYSNSNIPVSVCRIPTMDNASPVDAVIGRPVLVGKNVTYQCSIGYTTNSTVPYDLHQHGYVEMTCLENGTWVPHQGNCRPKSCPYSEIQVSHGHLDQRDQAFIKHRDAINFTCDTGYQKQLRHPIYCSLGRVVPRNPLCVPASCHRRDLNFLPNMSTTGGHRFAHGTVVTVTCETGYELVNDSSEQPPRCHFGLWVGSFQASCERVLCPTPGNANFATIQNTTVSGVEGYTHGDRVSYQCVGNRVLEGNQFRDCNYGKWTGFVPECVNQAGPTGPLPCFLPEPSNGELYSIHGRGAIHIYSEGAPDGSRLDISVRCRDIGYNAQSRVWVECQNGNWSEPIPICVPIVQNCTKPLSASHVEQFVNGDETMDLLYFPGTVLPEGTVLVARCSDPGSYFLRGSARRTCRAGRWEGIEPICDHASTRMTFETRHTLQIRSDGTVVIYTRPDTWVNVYCRVQEGRFAEIENEHGWSELNDNRKIAQYLDHDHMKRARLNPARAEDSGDFTCRIWGTSISHTVRIEFALIECEVPGIPLHGERHDYDRGWKQGTYYMRKSIHYTCDSNYRRDGSSMITCMLGQWSHPVPTCEHNRCRELSRPANGNMIGGQQRHLGDGVLFSCHSGFELRGPVFIECLNNATWSHTEPECREIVLPPSPCDSAHCEVWEKCVVTGDQAKCGCISPLSCPESSGPKVCGTDGMNYTSLCRLKARACLLDNGVEEASSSDPCINGIIIQPETGGSDASPVASEFSEGESSWSGVDVTALQNVPQDVTQRTTSRMTPAVTTMVPNEERDVSTLDFCPPDICPMLTLAEACQNASAAVIAHKVSWNVMAGILEIDIVTVLFDEADTGLQETRERIQVVMEIAEQNCLCPRLLMDEWMIMIFSQQRSHDGIVTVHETDYIQPLSYDTRNEIVESCQQGTTERQPATTRAEQTTKEPDSGQPDGSISSIASSSDTGDHFVFGSSESDIETTTSPATYPPGDETYSWSTY